MGGRKATERPDKRVLVRWSDDLDKQVLLSVQYACNEAGLRIPWDEVANLMGPKFTGGAIIQHLSKIRQKMVSVEMQVPPPLKRGVVNSPSKVYAAGNKRKRAPAPAKSLISPITTPKSKRGKTKKVDSDEDDEDEVDDDATIILDSDSDEEYGTVTKKRRATGGQTKAKKEEAPKESDEDIKAPKVKIPTVKAELVKAVKSKVPEEIAEGIESPSRKPNTRGIKHNYSKIDEGSKEIETEENEEDAEDGEDGAQGSKKGTEVEIDDETIDGKPGVKSDGEVSPRTRAVASPEYMTMEDGVLDVDQPRNVGHADTGLSTISPFAQMYSQQQYPVPTYQTPAFDGYAYHPSIHSSFSTDRTGSTASMTSSMAPLQPLYGNASMYGNQLDSRLTMNNRLMGNDQMYVGGFMPFANDSSLDFDFGGANFDIPLGNTFNGVPTFEENDEYA